jgi:hypothetical protein
MIITGINGSSSAITVASITASSGITLTGGQILLPNGSLATPAVGFTADTDAGIYYDGTYPKLVKDGGYALAWLAGATTFNGSTSAGGGTSSSTQFLVGDTTPTALAANTDNWAPTSFSVASRIYASASSAVNLTGLAGGSEGRVIMLWNTSANNITLKHDVTSTAANRFYLPGAADLILAQYSGVLLIYDNNASRWFVAARSN